MFSPIEVEGLAELDRAFGQVDKNLRKELRVGLREAAQPVAALSHQFALAQISGLARQQSIDWSQFRIGGGTVVYVAPKERGRRGGRGPAGRRPNLANLLVESMDRAAEQAGPRIERYAERAVERAVTEAGLG